MPHRIPGVVCVCKPPGMTSHDVVYKIKRVYGQKAGHTGTLDPDAEGVLPVCVGNATKISGLMTGSDKEYRVEVLFGAETDTQDATGNILREKPLEAGKDKVLAAIESFRGDYSQVPPMYSAVKIKGKKLYELARKGIVTEREPRNVRIIDIRAEELGLPGRAVLAVRCSKGAYMRTLCEDLGRKLDSCAHMGRLVRTEAAGFHLRDSHSLEEILQSESQDNFIVPITEVPALRGLRHIEFPPELDKKLLSGGVFYRDDIRGGEKVLAFTSGKILAGIYIAERDSLKPFIMLYPGDEK